MSLVSFIRPSAEGTLTPANGAALHIYMQVFEPLFSNPWDVCLGGELPSIILPSSSCIGASSSPGLTEAAGQAEAELSKHGAWGRELMLQVGAGRAVYTGSRPTSSLAAAARWLCTANATKKSHTGFLYSEQSR